MNRKLYPLCENYLYVKAYRNGKSDAGKYTAVYVLKNYRKDKEGKPLPDRLGLSINRKLGKACKRSRVKRIIREGYRAVLPKLREGYIIVIAARGAAFGKKVKSTDIERQLTASFAKLGLLENKEK